MLIRPYHLGQIIMLLFGLVAFAACSFDYGADLDQKELLDKIPDMSMSNLKHSIIRGGTSIMKIEAAFAVIFSRKNYREMTGISFKQYDSNGVLSAEGTAEKARQDIKTEDVSFSGKVTLKMVTDDSTLSASNLFWEANSKRFTCPETEIVTFQRNDGTIIQGRGLIMSTLERSVEFTGACSGTLAKK